MKICIIGCGPSGMALLSAFRHVELNGHALPELICYEKQDDLSGLWNYTWRTGTDEYGESIHGSMYKSLWSNGPKECLEMADYTFDQHFKRPIPSFPPRIVLQDYLLGRGKHYNIERFVRLNTVVRDVKEVDEKFSVTTINLRTKETKEEIFDCVIVATGHFSVPHVPSYPGLEEFPGRIIHSHDFRKATEFKGQKVVVIGSSYSAEDIALQLYKYGAKESVISCRNKKMNFKWPSGVREVGKLKEIKEDVFHFEDGNSVAADALIFCTGYKHHFPFMEDKNRLDTSNLLYPDKLYKGIVYQENENLLYLGMQDQYYTFTMFDAQAWYARDYILGKIQRKDRNERDGDIRNWYARGQDVKSSTDGIDFQRDYIADLLKYTDYPAYDNDKMASMLKEWKQHKYENILTYRDKCFASAITGTMATKMTIPWLDAKDFTLEWFINN